MRYVALPKSAHEYEKSTPNCTGIELINCPGSNLEMPLTVAERMFSTTKIQASAIEIELMGERSNNPNVIPTVPYEITESSTFPNVEPNRDSALDVYQRSVFTSFTFAKDAEIPTLTIAEKQTVINANEIMARYLPAKSNNLLGSRTNKFLNVPFVYSIAVCAANTHSAMTPSNPAEFAKPTYKPFGKARVSRVMIIPSRPFPRSESKSKNSSDEINPVNPMTAAKVPRNKVGRRNLRYSDLNIRIINYHLSIQRKFLPRLDVQLRVMKELFQIQKLIY